VRSCLVHGLGVALVFVACEAAASKSPPPVWVRHRVQSLPGIANDPIAGWVTAGTSVTAVTVDPANVVASSIDFGAYVFLAGPVYLGPTFQIGWLESAKPRGGAHVVTEGGSFTQIAGALGVETFASDRISFRFEALVGWHRVFVRSDVAPYLPQGAFLLQPRAVLDVWGSSRFAFALWLGTDALHPADLAGGLGLCLHFTDFDEPPRARGPG
jgi:hypothetical protein